MYIGPFPLNEYRGSAQCYFIHVKSKPSFFSRGFLKSLVIFSNVYFHVKKSSIGKQFCIYTISDGIDIDILDVLNMNDTDGFAYDGYDDSE